MVTQLLNRMKLWQKLGWLVVAMAVPICLVGFFYLRLADTQVEQAREELDGARYLQALSDVESGIITHRSRAFVFLSGDAARRNDVVAQQDEVDKQITVMDAVDAQLGGQLGAASAWQSLKSEWAALKSKALQQSVAESDAAHDSLIDHLQQLVEVVGASSKTTLDPEVETHALIHLASDDAPKATVYATSLGLSTVKPVALSDPGMLGDGPTPGPPPQPLFARAVSDDRGGATLALKPEQLTIAVQVHARFAAG